MLAPKRTSEFFPTDVPFEFKIAPLKGSSETELQNWKSCTYIILLEEPRVLQSVLCRQDDVFEEFAVGERRDVIVAAEVLRQPLQSLRVDATGVDPLRLGVVDVLDVGRHLRGVERRFRRCRR